MAHTPHTPTPKCEVCGKAWSLKAPDPDGGRRCWGHSTHPAIVARRDANASHGKLAGELQRGVQNGDRAGVLAGKVPVDEARARAAKEKAKRERKVDPIPMDTPADVTAFVGRALGELMDEQPTGWASAAAALANVALKAMGVEAEPPDDDEVVGWSTRRVDRNTPVTLDA